GAAAFCGMQPCGLGDSVYPPLTMDAGCARANYVLFCGLKSGQTCAAPSGIEAIAVRYTKRRKNMRAGKEIHSEIGNEDHTPLTPIIVEKIHGQGNMTISWRKSENSRLFTLWPVA